MILPKFINIQKQEGLYWKKPQKRATIGAVGIIPKQKDADHILLYYSHHLVPILQTFASDIWYKEYTCKFDVRMSWSWRMYIYKAIGQDEAFTQVCYWLQEHY